KIGRAFVHHGSGAGGERAVNDVAVARDPPDVGGTPIGIGIAQVEDPLHSHGGLEQVAAGGVHDALRFAGGAGRVEDEEGMLAVEVFGRAFFGDAFVERVPPMVAAVLHLDGAAGPFVNDHVLHGGAVDEGLVDGIFEADFFPAAPGAIAGDYHLRF